MLLRILYHTFGWHVIVVKVLHIFLLYKGNRLSIFCMICASLHCFGPYGKFSLLPCYVATFLFRCYCSMASHCYITPLNVYCIVCIWSKNTNMAINMDGLLHDTTTLQNYSKAQMNIVEFHLIIIIYVEIKMILLKCIFSK